MWGWLASRSYDLAKEIRGGALPCCNEAAMVGVFVTTEFLSDELRAVISGKAAALRDDNLAEKSTKRAANSWWRSASGCGGGSRLN